MKRALLSVLLVLGLSVFWPGLAIASGAPYRHATRVADVFKPYAADEWIISPDEEETGEQTVTNAPECDIQGVISCFDEDYLRFDLLLNHSVSFKWDIYYAIKLEYNDMNEYYTYYTDTKELIYEKEVNGRIVRTETLSAEESNDTAGVTSSGDAQNIDVYFIISKADHMAGTRGEKYFFTCQFLSGYVTENDQHKIADQTIPVDLEYVY